jgi:hypothetical protein
LNKIKEQKTRDNHYVPQWHKKGFIEDGSKKLHYLDLFPEQNTLNDGRVITYNDYYTYTPTQAFFKQDLYTTFFGNDINDDIETYLFGAIDDMGARAVKAFIDGGEVNYHNHFSQLLEFIDAQKLRTPKGLDWIKNHYSQLNQVELMTEMQAIRSINSTMWAEGVREIVSARNADVKFIVSDHPITLYNHAIPPESDSCAYPNDANTAYLATQTIFPLDKDHCLILTHYEYASEPKLSTPYQNRTNARNFSNSLVKTDSCIRERMLNDNEVHQINFIIKSRAKRYIAAGKKEWLYPENSITLKWKDLRKVLLPPKNSLFGFGGETFIGYKDGTTHYQDAFGRTKKSSDFLNKKTIENLGKDEYCSCGSGKRHVVCCFNKPDDLRPATNVRSIRERNLMFLDFIYDELGLTKGKTWLDIRKELSDKQVKNIYYFYSLLWPQDTDIISLLPKPDGCFRALYTGLIDPRTITCVATSMTLNIDELLIVQPFINPNFVNSDFSPVENPSKFKAEVLKNIMLLLELEPFIAKGMINFIPDFSTWNPQLGKNAFKMADSRLADTPINPKQLDMSKKLFDDDYQRIHYMEPDISIIAKLKKQNPDISEKMIIDVLKLREQKKLNDNLLLLQEQQTGEENSQFIITHLSPNFEFSLFIAQITGSFILTDSPHRWDELVTACSKEPENLMPLITQMNNEKVTINVIPDITIKLCNSGKFNELKDTLRLVNTVIKSNIKDRDLTAQLNVALSEHNIKMKNLDSNVSLSREKPSNYNFDFKMHCRAPTNGIYDKNVQRLLLSWGSTMHTHNVPWALYLEMKHRTTN